MIMTKSLGDTRKDSVRQHYEEQWEDYNEEDVLRRVEHLENVIEPMISGLTLRSTTRILDIGSGPGIIPLRIAQKNPDILDVRIIGIDIAKKAIEIGNKAIARNRIIHSIYLVRGDAEALPFQNHSFDAIISNATINLLLDKEKGFLEIARVIKEGGMVMLGDCTARTNKQCCQKNDEHLWSACIAGAPTKTKFQTLAQEAGLEIQNVIDMTEQVTGLVKLGLWDWPEFIQYDMEYHVFVMRKG
ncbi:MAG: class I SAM-dependent methyltransferase [Thermoplasmata archaeon]|nr:MAG: class I SAM-dependent methyltransferase [Thermoplasmata archaeon]